MLIKKIIYFTILNITLLSLDSCAKNDNLNKDLAICSVNNTVKFPPFFLDYFYFKDSTYWIYEETKDKFEDSIWVEKSSYEQVNEFQDRKFKTKCYDLLYYEKISNYERSFVVLAPINTNYGLRDLTKENFKIDFAYESSNYRTVYRAFIEGGVLHKINQHNGVWDTLPKLKLEIDSFQNVLHIKNHESNKDPYLEAWYAKNIGLVKFIKKDGKTWELIRYNIKQ